MKPEIEKAIEKAERDGERLEVFLQNVRIKFMFPSPSPEDIDELLAEAGEFGE